MPGEFTRRGIATRVLCAMIAKGDTAASTNKVQASVRYADSLLNELRKVPPPRTEPIREVDSSCTRSKR